MFARRLLYLVAHRLQAYHFEGGKLTAIGEFADSPDGLQAFGTWVACEDTPVHLLVDLIETDTRLEIVPHVAAWERRRLIERRLAAAYRTTPYRQAVRLGREQSGRRDDRYLFSAITDPEVLSPWMDALQRAETPLATIVGLPLLVPRLLADLPPVPAKLLLITCQEPAGLRLNFLAGGELRFSRLAALESPATPDTTATAVLEETARTQQYLSGIRLVNRDESLDIWIMDREPRLARLTEALVSTASQRFTVFPLPSSAEFDGQGGAERLYLHHLGKNPPRHHLAGSGERFYFWRRRLKQALQGSAALVLVAAALYSADTWLDARQATLQADADRLQANALQRQYDEHQQQMPKPPVPAEHMKELVAAADMLATDSAPTGQIFDSLSRALERTPEIRIMRLAWRKTARPDTLSTFSAPPAAIDRTDGPGNPPETTSESGQSHWTALLEGEIDGTRSHRQILEAIGRLREGLEGQEVIVSSVQLPFDTRSSVTLKVDTEAKQEHVRFVLRMVWSKWP